MLAVHFQAQLSIFEHRMLETPPFEGSLNTQRGMLCCGCIAAPRPGGSAKGWLCFFVEVMPQVVGDIGMHVQPSVGTTRQCVTITNTNKHGVTSYLRITITSYELRITNYTLQSNCSTPAHDQIEAHQRWHDLCSCNPHTTHQRNSTSAAHQHTSTSAPRSEFVWSGERRACTQRTVNKVHSTEAHISTSAISTRH